MEDCTKVCCSVVCFSVWCSLKVRSAGYNYIRFRRVFLGMEGRLGRRMLCRMKGLRVRNHTASFRHAKHRNSTELSKYIWTLKDNNINFFISWRILSSSLPYKSSNKRCNLCLKEKFLIICRPELSSLNKRNELVSSCRHRNKALLHYS